MTHLSKAGVRSGRGGLRRLAFRAHGNGSTLRDTTVDPKRHGEQCGARALCRGSQQLILRLTLSWGYLPTTSFYASKSRESSPVVRTQTFLKVHA